MQAGLVTGQFGAASSGQMGLVVGAQIAATAASAVAPHHQLHHNHTIVSSEQDYCTSTLEHHHHLHKYIVHQLQLR